MPDRFGPLRLWHALVIAAPIAVSLAILAAWFLFGSDWPQGMPLYP